MKRDDGEGTEARLTRRVLEAAAARPEEVASPSPFFAARLRARIAEVRRQPRQAREGSVGVLAWRLLPGLALGLAVLVAWTGYESVRAERAQDEAVSLVDEPGDLVSELFGDDLAEATGERLPGVAPRLPGVAPRLPGAAPRLPGAAPRLPGGLR